MRTFVPAASITLMLAGAASADLTVDLGDNAMEGAQGFYYDIGPVTGTLTGVSVSFDFIGDGSNYAGDLAIIINDDLQFGGFDGVFPHQHVVSWWDTTSSDAPGHYEFFLASDVPYVASSYRVLLGNDYMDANVSNWNNVMATFHGVNGVPAPGALALLGLAGLAGRRRRA